MCRFVGTKIGILFGNAKKNARKIISSPKRS